MSKHSFLNRLIKQIENDETIEENAHISNIVDNLIFLGSQTCTDENTLIKHNIKHVISIGCNPLCEDIRVFKYEIEDNGDNHNVKYFFNTVIPDTHRVINECIYNKEPILVHCLAGRSRSATVIITWLMIHKKMSYQEALLYVKERRPVVSPNITFVDYMKQL